MSIHFEIGSSQGDDAVVPPQVDTLGKVTKRATWDMVEMFTTPAEDTSTSTSSPISSSMSNDSSSETCCKLVETYHQTVYGTEGVIPDTCWIRDDPIIQNRIHPIRPFCKEFGWEPVRVRFVPQNVQILKPETMESTDSSTTSSVEENRNAVIAKDDAIHQILCTSYRQPQQQQEQR